MKIWTCPRCLVSHRVENPSMRVEFTRCPDCDLRFASGEVADGQVRMYVAPEDLPPGARE